MMTTPSKSERGEGISTPETPDTHDGSFDDDGNDSDEECPFDECRPRLRLGSTTTTTNVSVTNTATPAIIHDIHEEKVLGIAARTVESGSGEDYHIRRIPSSSPSSDDASVSSEHTEGSQFCSFVVRKGTGIVSCLTVVLVILVVLFVSNKNNKESDVGSNAALDGGESSNATAPPYLFETKAPSTMAPADPFWDSPAMSPSTVDRKTKLVEFLTEATAAGTFKLNFDTEDPTSLPNNLAIKWFLEEDTDDVDDRIVYDEKLIQRFALVALDFAMTAGRGGGGDPPPFFDTDTASTTVETDVEGFTTWSTPTTDECAWFGVVCNETVVTELHWAGLGLTGSIPDVVAVLSDLTQIDFSNNALLGSIPESLYGLTELRSIYFYKNNLTGTLSDGIGNLQSLVHLMLNENNLAGPFPTTLRSNDTYFPPIEYLNLYKNSFTGTLPNNMILRSLFLMDLGFNRFTGTLPSDLDQFYSLRHLALDHNAFVGTIPSTFPSIGNGRLETLSLNNNQLTGSVPSAFQLYNKLVSYTLQDNMFTQGLDQNICRLSIMKGEGENVEFKADCDICTCDDFFCDYCWS